MSEGRDSKIDAQDKSEFEGGIQRMTGIKRIQINEEWADSTIIEAGNFIFVGYCMKK
jgi:hypothetical protein